MSEIDNPGHIPFRTLLKRFRQRGGFTQEALAYKIGKRSRGSIQVWESELLRHLPDKRETVLALARALQLTKSETDTLLLAAHHPQEYHTQGSAPFNNPLPPSEPPRVWNVPYLRNPLFTGRDELLNQLDQRLSPDARGHRTTVRQVVLKGLGGIGKTQVDVEYAYRSRDLNRYTHTFWVNAASEEALLADFVELAQLLPAFSAKGETDQRKLVAAIKRWLEQCQQSWLLIFDNADDVALVHRHFPQWGNGSILLTTLADAVSSLATPLEVEKMDLIEGTQFLLRRIQRERAFDEESNEAINIVIALDCFPLALDQAGAYIDETKCGFADYLIIYRDHRKELLARRGGQTTYYPDTVATTWSLSFQRVEQNNPAAAELLRLCAFLASDKIPEELIRNDAAQCGSLFQEAVTDLFAFNQVIEELLKFSLVKRLAEAQALSIHRLVQAVQVDTIEPEMRRQWAERVVRAVNEAFPRKPNDVAAWPQCLRYLDQAQACNTLIEHYALSLIEAGDLLNRTGLYMVNRALYTIAEPLYQRAISIREQLLGIDHPDTASSLNNLAGLYFYQRQYALAEPLYQRALAIREQYLGDDHPDTATSLNNLALLYIHQEKYSQAELLYVRALSIYEQHLGANHPDTATSLNNLAGLYFHQEKYALAEPLYARALSICEQHLGADHPSTAASLNNLAALYNNQGKYALAEPLYRRALTINEQTLGAQHPNTKTTRENYIALLRTMDRHEETKKLEGDA